jgi:predicted SnoaL-like aldol condensation-catalyzing enzyme
MPDLEQNKETVRAFYELAFNDKKPEEAVARYVGSTYTQHNPMAGDGPQPFIEFVKGFVGQFPDLSVDIKRVIAEGISS